MRESDYEAISASVELNSQNVNIFNNEIIGCIAIYSVLEHVKILSIAKTLLILPLACHNELVSYIGRASVNVKSIEQLAIRKPDVIANFNARYYSLLEVSVNSVLILNALKFINVLQDGRIELVEGKNFIPKRDKIVIGNRAANIIKSSAALAKIIEDNVENLYLQLRVKI